MKDKLNKIEEVALQDAAGAASEVELQQIRARYLGKKGEITAVMKGMGQLTAEERPQIGALANQVKDRLEEAFADRQLSLRKELMEQKLSSERIDVTLPGRRQMNGFKHPITQVTEEVVEIFAALGFGVARLTHMEHHKHTNDPELDPDYTDGAPNWWKAIIKTWWNRQPGVEGSVHRYKRMMADMDTPASRRAVTETTVLQLAMFATFFAMAWSLLRLAEEKSVSSRSRGVWGTRRINQKNFTGISEKASMKASNRFTPIIM